MKKVLFLFGMMLMMVMAIQAQTIVIRDGFEDGILDSIWTQEFVSGETPWAVEDLSEGLSFPSTVVQGTKRAYLRNTTGETEHFVTRLVSRVMDLSQVYQPLISFYYANPKWTADRDTLRVLYRTSEKGDWKLLQEFSTASADWQKVNISLPEYNSTYQVAFEGAENLGRGIVLDSVLLRSAPECTVPHDISVLQLGNGKGTLNWQASFDADYYDLIIANEAIDPDTIDRMNDSVYKALIVVKEQIDGLTQSYDMELTSGAYYNVYLRSVCAAEISNWNSEVTGQFRFRMLATKYVPYFYDFNMDYHAGMLSRDLEWTWGGNTGHYNPYITTNLNSTECKKYSNDGTICLAFTGDNNATTAIPAGQYAYVATPGLADSTVNDFKLSNYQVRFWSTVHTYTGRMYAHSLIVGVMTNPEDVTTFVPVDTVSVYGTSEFVENIVSLENYQGDGVYVAFASYFDKKNNFYVDNVTIEKRPALQKVTKVTVNPRDTFATISWEGNAASYNLLITTQDVPMELMKDEWIVEKVEGLTATSYVTEKLEADYSWNRPYYVYVQAVNGNEKTEWSYRYPFVTIARALDPVMSFNMEQNEISYYMSGDASRFYPGNIGIFSNDPDFPYLYATNPRGGKSCLYMSKDKGNDVYATFPEVEDLTKLQITFFLSGSSTPAQAKAILGVMTNPMDISTFEPLQEYVCAGNSYYRCYYNFQDYKGEGRIIAIVWGDVEEDKNTNNYIDDVTIEEISSCVPPFNWSEVTPNSATIFWTKGVMDKWELIVSKTQYNSETDFANLETLLDIMKHDTITWDGESDTIQVVMDGLKNATGYNYYIRTLCSEAETSWWSDGAFKTTCPEYAELPFFDGFEDYSGTDFGCWVGSTWGTSTGTYPKLLTGTSYVYEGNYCLELWSTSTTWRSLMVAPYKFNIGWQDLLCTFMGRSYSSSSESMLVVGTIASPMDTASFYPIDTIYFHGGEGHKQCVINFANYTGSNEYVAFTTGLSETLVMNSDFVMDNVQFTDKRCAAPYNIEATDVTDHSMTVNWDGIATEGGFEFLMLKKFVNPVDSVIDTVRTDSTLVVKLDTIALDASQSVAVDGLGLFTKYYVYIRPLCGLKPWAVDSVSTECFKLNPRAINKETFETYEGTTSYTAATSTKTADCWFVDHVETSAPSTTYENFIYKSTTYAFSGENTQKLYGYYSATETSNHSPAWLASPEIDTKDMANIVVTFAVYASSSYATLFGVMSDPEDISTFVVLDSIVGTAKSVAYTYVLSEYADQLGDAKYVAWRTQYGKTAYIYLDDISIIESACPTLKPSLSLLTDSSATVNSGLRVNNPWEIYLFNKEISADSLEAIPEGKYILPDSVIVQHETITSGRSYQLKGMEEYTDYCIAVRSNCGEDEEGNPSNGMWRTLTFRTLCKAKDVEELGTITFSAEEGYVSGSALATKQLPCWTIGTKKATTTVTYIPYVNNTAAQMHNGNYYLYFYAPAATVGAYAIMPTLDVDDISNYQMSFYGRRGSTTASYLGQIIVGIITDPSDLSTFVPMDTIVGIDAYQGYTISFEDYEGDAYGNKGSSIMFLNEFETTNYFNVTEITVEKIPACPTISNLRADSIMAESVIASWDGKSEKYRVMVSLIDLPDSVRATYDKYVVDTIVTHADSVQIFGLNPGKKQYMYIQSICGTDTSKVSLSMLAFVTECPEAYKAPYFTTFDDMMNTGSSNRPDCWEGGEWNTITNALYSTQTYPYVNTTVSNSYDGKGYSLYMYSYHTAPTSTSPSAYVTYAVAPAVAGNVSDYMVSFYVRKSTATATTYGKTLRVGYVTDASCVDSMVATFVKIADVDADAASTNYVYCEVPLAGITLPAGARITLYADPAVSEGLSTTSAVYGGFYVDNFRIGLPPTCYAPVALAMDSVGFTGGKIHIRPYKPEDSKWQLAIIPDSVYTKLLDPLEALETDERISLVEVNDSVAVIDALSPNTKYHIYARTMCGGEDGNSAWTTSAIDFYTKFYYADSYFFGFEKDEDWVRATYSTNDSYYTHPAIELGYWGGTTASTSYSYLPYASEQAATATLWYAYKPTVGKAAGYAKIYNYTTDYGGYIMFPALQEVKNARSFSFQARAGYQYSDNYSTKANQGKMSTTHTGACFEIGTVKKGAGMESYQKIAFVTAPNPEKETEIAKKTVCTEANNWLFTCYNFELDSATAADCQVVMRVPKSQTGSATNIYFDNVTMGDAMGYGTPALDEVLATSDTTATLTWSKLGGPWNVFVVDTAKHDTVAKLLNTTITSWDIKDLEERTVYQVILNAANAPEGTKVCVSDSKYLTMPCHALEPDANGEFVFNFNNPDEWGPSQRAAGVAADSLFVVPDCWTSGSTYGSKTATTECYTWFIVNRAYADPKWRDNTGKRKENSPTMTSVTAPAATNYYYEMGRNNSPGLKVYSGTSTTSYMTPYIVMPPMNCDFKDMMVEFWGRCLYNYTSDHATATSQNKIAATTYLGTSYSRKMVVGTLDDPNDFSTLQVLDTVEYPYTTAELTTSMKVTEDPSGNRYWTKFQMPLAKAKGKYIVFFQPAYGMFFMDDVTVKPVGDNLFAPKDATVDSVKTTQAFVHWSNNHPTKSTVVILYNKEQNEIMRDTLITDTYTFEGLEPGEQYYWNVYQTDGTTNDSPATVLVPFSTPCLDITPDYTCGFEIADGWYLPTGATSNTYKATKCWVYGNAGTTTAWSTSFPYNYASTSTMQYGHTGDFAMKLYAYSTTLQTYAAMPAIEDVAAYDTLQVNFWMLPATISKSTGKISTQYTTGSTASTAEYYYAHTVIVGTMTDPNDATTFVPIDTITYGRTLTTSDEANVGNDFLFEKVSVPLRGATGPYVAFMSSLYMKGDSRKGTYDHVWLDDVSFSKLQECKVPTNLTVDSVEEDAAKLSWQGCELSESFLLEVSTDPTFSYDTAVVFKDTVLEASYVLTGLQANTEYYWHVASLCGEQGESEYSAQTLFRTLRTPFFLEDFRDASLNGDWKFATNPAALVLDSANVEFSGANSTTYGWKRLTNNYGITGAHYCTPFYSSSATTTTTYDYYWMFSPVLALAQDKVAHLTMDVALTQSSTSSPNANPVTEANMADDFIFMIAISEDGGKTWMKKNATIFCNQLLGGNQLRDIPATAANLRLDLSEFVGKNIQIGFYRECTTYLSTTCALHIGNIRVSYFDNFTIDTTACQYQDIITPEFYIDGDSVSAGEHKYQTVKRMPESKALEGAIDTVYMMTANILPVPETMVKDTICEGDTYTGFDFHGKAKDGVYRRKLQSVEFCDSIVTLTLNVTKRSFAPEETKTLCPGETYEWHGQTLSRPGIYRDTTVSAANCDSVETLVLSFYSAEDTIFDATTIEESQLPFTYENALHPYIVGQTPITYPVGTQPGTYQDTVLVLGTNCTAVLVHTLTITPFTDLEEILNNALKQGTRKVIYNEHLYIIRRGEWMDVTGQKMQLKQ